MLEIDLKEYQQSGPLQLTAAQVRALQSSLPSINVAPTGDAVGEYLLTPGSTVGALEVGELSVLIEPKIGIPQLLSLACYAMSEFKPQAELFDFPREYALPDVLALALAAAARQAFSRGLLHGYRVEEEALHTVRGRVMIAEQLRTRFGHPVADRGALRRVHKRHPGEPVGKGGGVPAGPDEAAFAGGAPAVGQDCGDARERLVGGLFTE